MPASLAPGTSVSPSASSVAAWSALSVRSGTPSAWACRGVSMTSAPPTVKASTPSPAPCTKARRSMPVMMFPPRVAQRLMSMWACRGVGEIQRPNGGQIEDGPGLRVPARAALYSRTSSLPGNSRAYGASVRPAAKKVRCFQTISHKIIRKPAPQRDRSVTRNLRRQAMATAPDATAATRGRRFNRAGSLCRCRLRPHTSSPLGIRYESPILGGRRRFVPAIPIFSG